MRRREFITLVGGAASWPIAARAQQLDRTRLVGALVSPAADRAIQSQLVVFQEELRRIEWTDGKNIRFDTCWGSSDFDLVRSHAAALVELGPDVIFSVGAPATAALQRATNVIPIVFVQVADPVGGGFVADYFHGAEFPSGPWRVNGRSDGQGTQATNGRRPRTANRIQKPTGNGCQ